jgi:flavin-dependent dehydrogenase
VVAGGGPAGAAAALTLVRAGRRVLLADAGGRVPKTGESLAPAARLLLADLGVDADRLATGHRRCYGTLSSWGTAELHAVDFINDPHGPGWLLRRPVFDAFLRQRARDAGADVAEDSVVGHPVRERSGGWRVTLRSGRAVRSVRCRWLVDATGRRAAIARRLGARTRRYDQLVALHLTLPAGPGDNESLCVVEAAPDGWWYTAPHHPHGRTVAYFTDADLAPRGRETLLALPRLLAAAPHTAARAGAFPPQPSRIRRAAAHTARLDPVAGDGWIAAGDAATAFDPLSAQGVLTALYSGLCAGQAVDAALDGVPGALDGYPARLEETFSSYLRAHRMVHRAEIRWPNRPFWERRHRLGPHTPLPAAHPTSHPALSLTAAR